jgi:hypothetical protein
MEPFDDDYRAAQCRSHRQIDRVHSSTSKRETPCQEKQPTQDASAQKLRDRCDCNHTPGPKHFLQIDLQPDHEEQQTQPNLANDLNVFVCFDKAKPMRTSSKAGQEIGQYQRLPEELSQHRQRPGGDDTLGDLTGQTMTIHGRETKRAPQTKQTQEDSAHQSGKRRVLSDRPSRR